MDEQETADRIADAFEAGIAPWSRSHRLGFTCGLPFEARAGRSIRGVDAWLLELSAMGKNYRSRFWSTRGGWEHLGGVVARGEGTPVIDDGAGGQDIGQGLLYNLEQVEVRPGRPVTSLDQFWVAGKALPDDEMAGQVLMASGARLVPDDCCRCLVHGPDGDRDFIGMLPLKSFRGDEGRYWSVLLHELIHWVVLRSGRLCRNRDHAPGELIAEFGAAFLTTGCGIPMRGDLDPDSDHVRAWITGIRRHHGYLTYALNVAELAAGLLLCQAGCEA